MRTSEKQLACLYNAKSVVAEATPGAKRAYVPRWKAGEPVSVSQLVMLPTHEVSPAITVLSDLKTEFCFGQTFAPSTNALKLSHKKESQLKMTVSHHAVIKIRFQPSASETLKEVTITSRNVSLISCKCLPNSLVLPPYTPKDAGLSQDSNETLTWLQLSRQKAQSAAGLDDCTCFNAKVFIQHPVSGEKAGMPLAIPVKATTALAECGIVNHTA